MPIKNQFIKNLFAAFLAQGITLFLNVIMSLVVPKALGVKEYGYWQLFVFYSSYVGFFHFGLIDGLYLRLGGKNFDELDNRKIATEYRIFLIIEILVAVFLVAISILFVSDINRVAIFLSTAVYMVVSNAVLFLGYIFQAVNETKIYSFSVIIDRIFVLLAIILLLWGGEKTYLPFVVTYTVSKLISLFYVAFKGRKIVFAKGCDLRVVLLDMWHNIAVGSNLMFANVASMLILGIGRMVIDQIWGIEYFGKISFSLSLTNFFLLFIQQVSMVLFPVLRRFSADRLVSVYENMKIILDLVLPVAFVLYIPMKMVLVLWLPNYKESLDYLALLLPICTFDGKMQMLYNTYLKVLREEKKMFRINVISCVVSAGLAGVNGFVFHNFGGVVISMLCAVAFRSIYTELYLSRKIKGTINMSFLSEITITLIFVVISWNFEEISSFIFVTFAYIIYLLLNRKKICAYMQILRKNQ